MSNSINLIGHKEHDTVTPASRKLKIVRAVAVLMLCGVSGAAIILFILIAFSPLPQVQQQEQDALARLASYKPEMTKIAYLDDRMKGIVTILAERNDYGAALNSVVNKMPQGLSMHQIDMKK